MKARISQLCKTEAEWDRFYRWAPEPGEIVVYLPDEKHPYARIKIGDGRTLQELDFFVDSTLNGILKEWRYEELIDGGRITDYLI
jgi:hypothetical protein